MEKSGGSNEDAIAFLKARATELQKEYEQKEQHLQDYKKLHNLISLDDSLNFITDRLKSVNTAQTAAHLDRLALDVYAKQVDDFRKNNRDLLEISYLAGHATVPSLKAQLAEALQRQACSTSGTGAPSPDDRDRPHDRDAPRPAEQGRATRHRRSHREPGKSPRREESLDREYLKQEQSKCASTT